MIKIEDINNKLNLEIDGTPQELSFELCVVIDRVYELAIKQIPNDKGIKNINDFIDIFIKPALSMLDKE